MGGFKLTEATCMTPDYIFLVVAAISQSPRSRYYFPSSWTENLVKKILESILLRLFVVTSRCVFSAESGFLQLWLCFCRLCTYVYVYVQHDSDLDGTDSCNGRQVCQVCSTTISQIVRKDMPNYANLLTIAFSSPPQKKKKNYGNFLLLNAANPFLSSRRPHDSLTSFYGLMLDTRTYCLF